MLAFLVYHFDCHKYLTDISKSTSSKFDCHKNLTDISKSTR
jgi:hypothetical protein